MLADVPDDDSEDPTAQVIPINEAIRRLHTAGLSPEMISAAAQVPVGDVKRVIITYQGRAYTPDEARLAQEVRDLAHLALKRARLMLEFGPTEQKLAIVRALLPNLAKQYAADNAGDAEATRSELEKLLASQRNVPVLSKVVTDEAIIDVGPQAITLHAVDPN